MLLAPDSSSTPRPTAPCLSKVKNNMKMYFICTILNYTLLYCTILDYTTLYCIILNYTVVYHTILYYTMVPRGPPHATKKKWRALLPVEGRISENCIFSCIGIGAFVCFFVCLFASLLVCFLVCLSVRLLVCLCVCTCLFLCLLV